MTGEWLDLGARGVAKADSDRQTRSARLVTEVLSERPGFVLADEVGMGKTYVTFGHIGLRADQERGLRTLIVAPSGDLAAKWRNDLLEFAEKPSVAARSLGRALRPQVGTSTSALLEARGPGVVITTLSAVVGGLARTPEFDRAWMFEAALHGSRRHQKTRNRLARYFRVPAATRRWAAGGDLFGVSIERGLPIARRYLAPFLIDESSRRRDEFDAALRAARRHLIRSRLPRYDLLVLDEAHKLKNPTSKRYEYLEQILGGRFETMLFLTATPFQIDLSELAAVLGLLGHARGTGREQLVDLTAAVIERADQYRQSFGQLERSWRACPSERACLDPAAELTPPEQVVQAAYQDAIEKRDGLASVLAKVMLRERKDKSHRSERIGSLRRALDPQTARRGGVVVEGAGRVAFAASVRLFHEMRRNRRPTFDPVVLQSLTSSYEAFRNSQVRTRATRGREPFLAGLIDAFAETGDHPKIAEVVDVTVAAALRGEKTLIFTERLESAQALARAISDRITADAAELERRYAVDAPKRIEMLVDEFANRRSALSLPWRDNLLHTYLPLVAPERELRQLTRNRELRPVISRALKEAATGVAAATARKRDIVAAAVAVEQHVLARASMSDEARRYGFALLAAPEDADEDHGSERATDLPQFDAGDALRLLKSVSGFWARSTDLPRFADLEPHLRRSFVSTVRGALTREDTETRVALLRALTGPTGGSRAIVLDRAMASSRWHPIRDRVARFLDLVLEHETTELRTSWVNALAMTRGAVARLTGGEDDRERTSRGRAFNTPFRPYVVVATAVSQEGLDLQRECSHVIHHDLSWNPAALEQRVGRVDRIHSRTGRLREIDSVTELEIDIPIIRGTIDERMWRVVSDRRDWFDLCLGLEHDWESGSLDDATPALASEVAAKLRIDLSLAASR